MTITAELHDGRTLEFPDGTTPEVVQSTVKKVLGSDPVLKPHNPMLSEAGAITTRPQRATTGEFLLNSVKSGLGDIGGIADMVKNAGATLMFPARNVVEQITGTKIPDVFPSSRGLIDKVLGTDRNMQAPDPFSRAGGKVLEYGVSGLPFSAATVANSVRKLPAITAEVMSSVEGGIGADIGGDVGKGLFGEKGRNAGEAVGGILGGLTGLLTPTIADKGRAIIGNKLSKEGRDEAIRAVAGKELGGAMSANYDTPSNLALSAATTKALAEKGAGDFRPTLGQASGAPGVISREIGIAKSTPEDLGKYSQVAKSNQAVLDNARNLDFPVGGSIQRNADSILRKSTQALDKKLDEITKFQEGFAQQLSQNPKQEIGENLLKVREQAQGVARMAKNERIKDIYETADKLGLKEDMSDVLSSVKSIIGDDPNTFQNMPPVFAKVIKEYGGKEAQQTGRSIPPDLMGVAGITPKKDASFKELHSLWMETNSQLGAAQRAGNTKEAYYLGELKSTLKDKLAKYGENGAGELADKFNEFNKWYATKYAPAFYEGVGGRMVGQGRYGDIVKPEEISRKFFTPSGIDDFNAITQHFTDSASRTNANNQLKDGIVSLFAEKAIKDGVIDTKAAKSFLSSNAETLNKVPDIKRVIESPVLMAEAMADRAQRIKAGQAKLDNSVLADIAKSPDTAKVVGEAINDQRKMMALIASAKTESSRRSVARAVADAIPDAASKAGVDPLTFVIQNEQILKPALARIGKDHFNNLKTLAAGETIVGRTSPPTVGVHSKPGDIVEQVTGSTPRTIWSQTANTAAGRQGVTSMVLHLLSRFGIKTSEEMVNNVMREVIYRPDLAQVLVDASRKPFSIGESNKLSAHLINAGIRTTSNLDEPKQ